ncbi:MAG TPA: PLP-dependent aminotransferase family protein [Euryarchaeota archaeon]|nr:PLP-dependent aminotransferase family protein [Euryarchaeota archaeon]
MKIVRDRLSKAIDSGCVNLTIFGSEFQMTIDFTHLYSYRARNLVASEIREILKLMTDPEIISFAGGMPNPDTFPTSIILEITEELLLQPPSETLQYGITEGQTSLRSTLADLMEKRGAPCEPENIVVTSGAQQGIDLASQLLLESGRTVITESPTFIAAIIGFRGYGADIHGIPLDREGIVIDLLDDRLKKHARSDSRPTMVYVIPNFQNPSGVTMSEGRRRSLIDVANEHDLVILEDDPYYDLRFEGDHQKPVKAFDDVGRVIYAGSFSKILSPGLRIGWITAAEPVARKIAMIKQTVDVCTNVLSQGIANEYISRGHLERHLPKIRELYGHKRDVMLSSLEQNFPDGATWTRPEGGMFLWVELPEAMDTDNLQKHALERKVAFVPGRLFFPDGSGKNTMRLSFSHPAEDKIKVGIARLGEIIREELKEG